MNDLWSDAYRGEHLPLVLRESWQQMVILWQQHAGNTPLLDDVQFCQQAMQVWPASVRVAAWCVHDIQQLTDWWHGCMRHARRTAQDYTALLQEKIQHCDEVAEFKRILRIFRVNEWMRIVWRDMTQQATLSQTVRELSALADVCVQQTVLFLQRQHQYNDFEFVVIALGKLGSQELNVSSDIDLIFCYEKITNNQYAHQQANRLGQQLIDILHQVTVEGFVFRVDMRLRPWGDAGQLVLPHSALRGYYLNEGQDWERYMLLKARIVYGKKSGGALLKTPRYRQKPPQTIMSFIF